MKRSALPLPTRRRLPAVGVLVATLLACPLTASARIAFLTHRETRTGNSPTAMVLVGSPIPHLAVASDQGIDLFRVEKSELVRSDRLKSVSFVKGLDSADVDGDGRPDLVCVVRGSRAVTVLPGRAQGSFGKPYTLEVAEPPRAVKARPINSKGEHALFVLGDGALAILSTSPGGSVRSFTLPVTEGAVDFEVGEISNDQIPDLVVLLADRLLVLPGKGNGTFGPPQEVAFFENARRVFLHNVDRDGGKDALVATGDGLLLYRGADIAAVAAALSEPMRAIEQQRLPFSGPAAGLDVVDLDGDGYADIAITEEDRGTLTVLMGRGEGTFLVEGSYVTGRGPGDVVLSDLNGDRMPDGVVLNHVGDSLTLLIGSHAGFRSSRSLVAGSEDLKAVAAGDFNGDGHADLAAISESSGQVTLFAGNGNGTFVPHTPVQAGTRLRAAVAGRFRPGDIDDLAIADFATDEVVVLHGGVHEPFGSSQRIGVGEGPSAIVAGPFAAEAAPALVTANEVGSSLSILADDGRGRFTLAQSIPVAIEPRFLLAGDVTGDGRLDLMAGNDRSDTVVVLAGTEHGLAPPRSDHLGDRARPLVAEDLDADGHVDLVMADEGGDAIEVLPGTGRGTFGARVLFPVAPHPHSAVVGDFNEDTRPDVAVVHPRGATITILLNSSGSAQAGASRP